MFIFIFFIWDFVVREIDNKIKVVNEYFRLVRLKIVIIRSMKIKFFGKIVIYKLIESRLVYFIVRNYFLNMIFFWGRVVFWVGELVRLVIICVEGLRFVKIIFGIIKFDC